MPGWRIKPALTLKPLLSYIAVSDNERKEFEADAPDWLRQALKRWRAEQSFD